MSDVHIRALRGHARIAFNHINQAVKAHEELEKQAALTTAKLKRAEWILRKFKDKYPAEYEQNETIYAKICNKE